MERTKIIMLKDLIVDDVLVLKQNQEPYYMESEKFSVNIAHKKHDFNIYDLEKEGIIKIEKPTE